jgi:hypothetical protein
VGGKRPSICSPGVDCAVVGDACGKSDGDVGAPVAIGPVDDLNFADVEGTGSQAWAGVGFAGSSGGALRLFFGTDEAGWECKTSLCSYISIRPFFQNEQNNPPS